MRVGDVIVTMMANIATPVATQVLLWIALGSVVIGLIEGLIVARIFKQRVLRCIVIMVVANAVSTTVGVVFFGIRSDGGVFFALHPPDLYAIERWLIIAYTAAFIGTVLVEWPFVIFAARAEKPLVRSAVAVIVAHVASYAIVFGAPWTLGWKQVSSEIEFDPALSFLPDDYPFKVYFIEHGSGDVVRMNIDGSERETVLRAGLTDRWARLFVYGLSIQPRWDLRAYRRVDERGDGEILIEEFADPRSAFVNETGRAVLDGRWMDFSTADLRLPIEQDWRFVRGGDFGLMVSLDARDQLGRDVQIEITRGVGSWKGRNATHLPHGVLVFELAGQICAVDVYAKQAGVIARGKGPVVVPSPPPR